MQPYFLFRNQGIIKVFSLPLRLDFGVGTPKLFLSRPWVLERRPIG